MKPLIDFNKSVELRLAIDRLSEVAGIKNQIQHLNCPDDNEVWEYIFEYFEHEINDRINGR